jgi:ATP-binding cassette subfamily C (CFTR/MRP) protein 4
LILPVTLGLLVRFLNKWNEEIDEGSIAEDFISWNSSRMYVYYCAATICILIAVNVIASHPYFLETFHLGMQIRIASCNLIYRKALKLSNSALRTTTVGQIVNLMSNDVNRFDWCLVYAHYLVLGPLQMCCVIALLWQQIGISCLAGIAVLILYVPFQGLMGHSFSKLRANSAILTDERLRLMSEIIPAMRVIKMYVWEIPFSKLVELARIREISTIQKSMILRSINLAIFFVSSKLITFLCLILFVISGGELNAENVFVSISLINQLREVMTLYFPYGVSLGAEALISLRRIQVIENYFYALFCIYF